MVRGVLTWLASWMFSAAAVITTMYVLYVGSSYLASVPTGCCAVQCIISHVYDIIYKPGTTYLLPLVICTGIPRVRIILFFKLLPCALRYNVTATRTGITGSAVLSRAVNHKSCQKRSLGGKGTYSTDTIVQQ